MKQLGYTLQTQNNKVAMAVFYSLIVYLSFIILSKACTPPVVPGLSYTFYNSTCPNLESIIRNHLRTSFQTDIGLAAGLLRLHFHDCFVQGCDASVLLEGSASGPSERAAPPNLTLRPSAFRAINELQALIQDSCGQQVVSCTDIVALAARDSVALTGGPDYRVPLGRRDSLTFATRNTTLAGLPSPSSNVSTLMEVFSRVGLNTTDLVALSGGHTVGISTCTSFADRLYPIQDPIMNPTFAASLRLTCPERNSTNTTVNDVRTPNVFDNAYYEDLLSGEGLFTSDQILSNSTLTSFDVANFALNQTLFFEQFAYSIVKMGQINVTTGSQGEIRTNCSVRNVDGKLLWDV